MILTASTTTDYQQVFLKQKAHQQTVAHTTTRERIAKLVQLRESILKHRTAIHQALGEDFRKHPVECDLTEIKPVITEINFAIAHLRHWMKPEKAVTPLLLIGTSSFVQPEPKGIALIISPWNFPLNLAFCPLASAIAAGNCVILKPSESAPAIAAVMKTIINEVFDEKEVALFEGDATVAKQLLELPFNHIFFTGSPEIGKKVMRAAAENLSSVTLELGGKCPVIVSETAHIKDAAAKIAWLKFMNNGQICISPDYALVHEKILEPFLEALTTNINAFYGKTPEARQSSPSYCRMVNSSHFRRVKALTEDARKDGAQIVTGGYYDAPDKYIDPTILTNVTPEMAIMQEEIFGPVLPVITYKTKEQAADFVNRLPTPLALYYFTARQSEMDFMIRHTKAGCMAINECGQQFYNPDLPFGGLNFSGIGNSHGKASFDEFSNRKGVLRRHLIPFSPIKILHPPYSPKLQWLVRRILRWP